ncbi:hypothetical protein C0V76_16670 [Uliginosibacterium sp. TH139]|nr:hypothetical protein C0V76_16670 [Uliginosibacterium sp. TH139]
MLFIRDAGFAPSAVSVPDLQTCLPEKSAVLGCAEKVAAKDRLAHLSGLPVEHRLRSDRASIDYLFKEFRA